MNILLGSTGSVAATLTPKLVAALCGAGYDVQVAVTEPSLYFFDHTALGIRVWRDANEWPNDRYTRDQPIPHIELRKWADVLVIAPLSANTLAKLSGGLCDNLLTSVVRAWDRSKPIVLVPAMNTIMWEHPATQEHLSTLRRWYPRLIVVEPVAKTLACGDVGIGAMAPIPTIVAAIQGCQTLGV